MLNLYPAVVITGAQVLYACIVKRIITMTVQNIMLVGEVFQIKVSYGLVHPLESRQNVNLYPAVVITGARAFRSLYAFRVQKDQMNECAKWHLY